MKPASPIAIRILAAVIDMGIFFFFWMLMLVRILSASELSGLMNNLIISIIPAILVPLCVQVIQAILTAKTGGTVGKLICGLRVVNDNIQPISVKLAFFRTFIGPIISSPIFGLGYIWIVLNPDRRGWHDMATGSRVIYHAPKMITAGILTFIIYIITAVYLLNSSLNLLNTNSGMYRQIIREIGDEFSNIRRGQSENSDNNQKIPVPVSPTPAYYQL